MKYIKKFERNSPAYADNVKVGDILICRESSYPIKNGLRYEVIGITKPRKKDEDKYYYFDVKGVDFDVIAKGYGAILFKPEYLDNENKFNL
jgi:hypothetical protein